MSPLVQNMYGSCFNMYKKKKNYLHKFKMADIGHFEFLTFDIIHIASDVIPECVTYFNTLISLEWLFLRFNVI